MCLVTEQPKQVKVTQGVYKQVKDRILRWYKIGDIYLLQQNPFTKSRFAEAARKGADVYWELTSKPIEGQKLAYNGNVRVDGLRFNKDSQTLDKYLRFNYERSKYGTEASLV